MAKVTPSTITGAYASTSELNANFALLAAEFENALSLDGTTPNAMSAEIDMNGYNIINIGSLLTQVVPDVISTDLWSPGYDYTYVSGTSFTVDGYDQTRNFRVNRRIRFEDADGDYSYGIIATSSYSAPDTTITMTMDTGTVPTTIVGLWFTTSNAYWGVVDVDPFTGGAIRDIATGRIGSTDWWVIVGDGGKIYTSTDVGLTWTARTSGSTGDIKTIAYSGITESFLLGGEKTANGGYLLLESSDGITWSDRDAEFNVTNSAGDSITDISANDTGDYWVFVFYDAGTTQWIPYVTSTNWTSYATTAKTAQIYAQLVTACGDPSGYVGWSYTIQELALYYDYRFDPSAANWVNETAANTSGLHSSYFAGTLSNDTYVCRGTVTGAIDMKHHGSATVLATDNTTFSYPINDFAASDTDLRFVCVGDYGTIGTLEASLTDTNNSWVETANGFDPSAHVQAVDYNRTDNMFIAVADNGQICRSTTGVA